MKVTIINATFGSNASHLTIIRGDGKTFRKIMPNDDVRSFLRKMTEYAEVLGTKVTINDKR